jgi:chemotaxis family two-component system response regulator Rcp1
MLYHPPIHVLLIEDNPADARLTQEAFDDSAPRCTIAVVLDGEEAMSYLRREGEHSQAPAVDLIILDLNLPKKDGREVLHEIKSDPVLLRIPVIVLTTSSMEDDIKTAYDSYANSYITKPTQYEDYVSLAKTIKTFWLTHVKLPSTSKQAF